MEVKSVPDLLEWLRFIFTIITPLGIFWLGLIALNRRTKLETLDKKITEIQNEIKEGRNECREDIQAVMKQLSEYPRRSELSDSMRELREDLRAYTKSRTQP